MTVDLLFTVLAALLPGAPANAPGIFIAICAFCARGLLPLATIDKEWHNS